MNTLRLRSTMVDCVTRGVLVPLLLILPAGSSHGDIFLETQASVTWGDTPGDFGAADFGISNASYSDGYDSGGSSYAGTSGAEATFGVLKALSTGTTVNASYLTQASQAFAAYADNLTFTVPSISDGRAAFTFTLTGSSTGAPAYAKITIINDTTSLSVSADLITTPGEYRLFLAVDYNVIQPLQFLFETSMRITVGESTTQTVDFSQTATLTKIELFETDSTPIPSFSVSSGSGTVPIYGRMCTVSLLT